MHALRLLAPIAAALLPFLIVASSFATEVAGKWGVGFSVGDLLDSRAEASIIRGKSAAKAWILDIGLNASRTNFDLESPDTSLATSGSRNYASLYAGPRFRRYTRPSENLSPYWDLYAHGRFNHQGDNYYGSSVAYEWWGGDVGLDFGAEYFLTRWPVSAAVHTTFLQGGYTHARGNRGSGWETSDTFSGTLRIEPNLQFRAYF